MGRKAKLTPEQIAEAQRRVLNGESLRAVARDLGVAESGLRAKISAQTAQIKSVANQLVGAERALGTLPISAQTTARTLAHRLMSLGDSLLSAADLGAKTAHRLSALANAEVQRVDDTNPLGSLDSLRGVAALTKLANDSAAIGLNLLAANRDAVKRAGEPEEADHDADARANSLADALERSIPR